MSPIEELTTEQQRLLCDICWRFEESWAQGKRLPPEAFLAEALDIAPELVLDELREVQQELEQSSTQRIFEQSQACNERYQFIEEIARGGAAVVWKVYDRHLQRKTAVKYLLDSCDNQNMRIRLEREARLCARLAHPGIVPIHELSNFQDGRPFVSMKLIEGHTLLQLLEQSPPIPTKAAIEIFTKVCQAVAHSHDVGIIHRDLKPSNIMVGTFGEVQVMDWGLAKDLLASPPSEESSVVEAEKIAKIKADADTINGEAHRLTSQEDATLAGTVFGTLSYMSPEQAKGQVDLVDQRSDTFSLGAILCRILTGLPPYYSTDRDKLLELAQSATLMSEVRQKLQTTRHRKLAELTQSCLSVDPNRRPENAKAVVNLLQEIQNATASRKKLWASIGGTTAIAGLLAIVTYFKTPMIPPSHIDTNLAPKNIRQPIPRTSDTVKSLHRSGQLELALESYNDILREYPDDLDLIHLTCAGLLNSGRYPEAEQVAHQLVRSAPSIPNSHFVLSETLKLQGKFEESLHAMQSSQRCRESGTKTDLPIDEKIAWLQKALEFSQKLTDSVDDEYLRSVKEAENAAKTCDLVGKVELAWQYYRISIDMEPDPSRKSLSRHSTLIYFLGKHLSKNSVQTKARDLLSLATVELLTEQLDFIRQVLNSQTSSAVLRSQAVELHGVLKRREKSYAFIDATVSDSRVSPKIRSKLADVLQAIDDINASSQVDPGPQRNP